MKKSTTMKPATITPETVLFCGTSLPGKAICFKMPKPNISPKKVVMKKLFLSLVAVYSLWSISFSQGNTSQLIQGKVKSNEKNEPLGKATVKIKGSATSTLTDSNGYFHLNVPSLPVTLEISFAEFETREMEVTGNDDLIITLEPVAGILNPVTLVGTRTQTRSLNSPVTQEYIGKPELINTPAESYWGPLLLKKGLDVTTSSLTYKTYSTRGFNLSGSARVNQFMDGMDNQAPGLNFSVGNFLGLADLDVESIEILPGASSALYGPGGINGTIIVNSKNPFKYPGLSIVAKEGLLGIGANNPRDKNGGFYDYSFRWAKKIGKRFAFKIGAQYIQATDWLANDSTNYLRAGSSGKVVAGNRQTDPNYDGVNVYGDETSLNMVSITHLVLNSATQQFSKAYFNATGTNPSQAEINGFLATNSNTSVFYNGLNAGLIPDQNVSRTGYKEIDVIDPKTKNGKLSGALHYQFNKNLEGIISGYWGTGNTVYTGNNRYVFKGIKMGQYKLELKHTNWFLRGYTTQENAGEAYSATVTSQYFNEAWKPSEQWYPQYIAAFVQAESGGASASAAHNFARSYADQGRPLPGSSQFKNIFDSVRKVPIPRGGLFLDKSQLWMTEGQYNFSDKIKFVELIVGANWKKYILNSQGTIFIDTAGALKINEWGSYAQVTKKLFNEKLVLSASERYDKNENFKGKLTPRITALIQLAENNNFRISYQTAYRFPSTQQQWIKLDVGNAFLLGGLPWITDYLHSKSTPTFILDPANGQMTPYAYKELKPELLQSFEIGFKSLVNKKLLLDAYAYFGHYSDFLGRIIVVQPTAPKPFSVVTNSDTKVKTWGMGMSLDYKMVKNYMLFFNAYTDKLTNIPTGFEAGFNTPKYRINAGFGNSGLGKKQRIGFNINLRWQDSFFYEGGGFADGDVKAYTTLDAQVNYQFPKIKSMIKLGGTNITNKYYQTSFGNPFIGGMYYVSLGYNIL
jgi:outer membrane receptor protein involved in Fe transport